MEFRYRLALQQTRVLQEFERRSIDLGDRILLHSADRLQPKTDRRGFHNYLVLANRFEEKCPDFPGHLIWCLG